MWMLEKLDVMNIGCECGCGQLHPHRISKNKCIPVTASKDLEFKKKSKSFNLVIMMCFLHT